MKRAVLLLLIATVPRCCPASITAETLFHKARGEGRQGILAVASVIWNRADGNPDRLEAVCLKRKQFSCWNQGYHAPKPKNELERCILAFCEGIESQMQSGTFRPTTGADHYLRFDCFPSWRKELKNQERIGAHIFGNCN